MTAPRLAIFQNVEAARHNGTSPTPTGADQMSPLEDAARREALSRYLAGDEEGALDLLVAARAIAGPLPA